MLKAMIAASVLLPAIVLADGDPSVACNKSIATDPDYASIVARLPLVSLQNITFAMLADDKKPDAKQRKAIGAWAEQHRDCTKLGEEFRAKNYPPQLTAITTQADGQALAIGADLYNRKLTFGDANKQLQKVAADLGSQIALFIQQATAEQAAEKQRSQEASAAQARQQDANRQALEIANNQARDLQTAREAQLDFARRQAAAQMIINNMNNYRAPQLVPYTIPQRPVVNTSCSRYGNETNCTSQ